MDDELQQLEAELRRLRPRVTSRALRDAIGGDLGQPHRAEVVVPRLAGLRLSWLALPIAACVAVIFGFALRSSLNSFDVGEGATADPPPEEELFKPVAARSVLLDSRDEGYVTLVDGTPGRRMREVSIDTITWKNPRTNASLTWTVPREEVRVVPVSLQ